MFKKFLSFALSCAIVLSGFTGFVNAAPVEISNMPFVEEIVDEEEAVPVPQILWGYPLAGTITSTVLVPVTNIWISLNDGADLGTEVSNKGYVLGNGKGGYVGVMTWTLTWGPEGAVIDAH